MTNLDKLRSLLQELFQLDQADLDFGWRNLDETDNDKLDEWFRKQGYSTRDLVFDLVYVNGDNNLENLRRPDQTWKVRMIEEEFQRLMFDVQDV